MGNLLQGFVWIALLGLSGKLSEWPLWLVILLQYGILIGLAMGSTWVSGQFQELASTAYRDEFRSVSIPYAVIVAVYYGKCYYELKKSNEILRELNGNSGS